MGSWYYKAIRYCTGGQKDLPVGWLVGWLVWLVGMVGMVGWLVWLVGWFVRYVMCVYFLLGYKTNWLVG